MVLNMVALYIDREIYTFDAARAQETRHIIIIKHGRLLLAVYPLISLWSIVLERRFASHANNYNHLSDLVSVKAYFSIIVSPDGPMKRISIYS